MRSNHFMTVFSRETRTEAAEWIAEQAGPTDFIAIPSDVELHRDDLNRLRLKKISEFIHRLGADETIKRIQFSDLHANLLVEELIRSPHRIDEHSERIIELFQKI